MATINTTKNYDKSFELLRAAIVDIERGSYLPNLDLCKKHFNYGRIMEVCDRHVNIFTFIK